MRFVIAAVLLLLAAPARAEDGYDLWLRYRPMEAAALAQYRPAATAIVTEGGSPTLHVARDELVRRQSRRAVDWTWGHLHRLDLENETLGQSDIGVVQWLFNRGGYEVGGGAEIVDATDWNAATDSFAVTAAPSMRMVVSLADFDDSRWVNLTGVSGHAFSDHYVDQTKLWVEGRSLPWRSSRAAVERGSEDTLTLMPRR